LGGSAKVESPNFNRKPTEENMTLLELLQKSGEGDFLRIVS
jgi:hypothetical protein